MTQIIRLNAVFREVFSEPDLVIRPDMTAEDVESWDSFNHINLVVGIEAAFSVAFTTREITGMRTVDDLITVMRDIKGVDISWDGLPEAP